MPRIHLTEDIRPLSEFRSKVAYYFDKVKETKRPLVITQNGKSAAVLLDVAEYESMLDKIELLDDIKLAENMIDKGMKIPHSAVKEKLSKR